MNTFSTTSETRLQTCHPDLQKVLRESLKISDIDFGIAEGHRSVELQQQYFKEGKSEIDGINKLGKHNMTPSMAADIYPWVNGKTNYNNETLSYLAGLIHAVATMLYNQGAITHKIRWGGNWDMDGEILTDQTLKDRPHVELYKP